MIPRDPGNDVSRDLPSNLTEHDIMRHSKELARLVQERNEVKGTKDEVAANYAAKLKKLDADISVISLKVATGREVKPTACYYAYDWEKGFKKLIRRDSGEIIEDLIHITELERQMHFEEEEKLPFEGGEEVREGAE